MSSLRLVPAAQYLRMSTQQQQYSLKSQAEANRSYAQSHSLEIVRTYLDIGKSGVLLSAVQIPRAKWLLRPKAFEAIVEPEVFEKTQQVLGDQRRPFSNHRRSTTCRKNNARTEVLEGRCENGGLDTFDDDRRDSFMTRCPGARSVPRLKST